MLLTLLFAACSEHEGQKIRLPYYNKPDFTPVFVTASADIEKIDHRLGSFSFTDQYGKKITDQNITGKIHVANFMFTSCGSICPLMTKHLKLVHDAFKNDNEVVLLSYSVTPWIDNVGRLRKYTSDQDIEAGNWHFLTGSKSEIYELARKGYFAEEGLGFTKDSTDFLHTEHFVLLDKQRRIRGIYNGTLALETEQLIRDIRILEKE